MTSIGRIRIPGIVAIAAAVACVSSVTAQQAPRLTGTVTYRERIALAPTAVLEVRLDDVTRAGGVPPVIAQLRVEQPGQVPMKFDMSYPATAIDPRGRYAVRATISDGGIVLFTSSDTALVLTQGRGTRVDLVLTRVAGANPPAPRTVEPPPPPPAPLPPNPLANLPATFQGTLPCADCAGDRYHLNLFDDDSFFLRVTLAGKATEPRDEIGSWALSSDRRVLVLHGPSGATRMFAVPSSGTLKLLDATGRPIAGADPNEIHRAPAFRPLGVRLGMRGTYSSLAEGDAATFVECSTGQIWPVATTGARKDLDAAYAGARSAPGAVVLAEIEGSVMPPRADGSTTQNTLVVNKVSRLLPRESCAPRFVSAPLTDTYWRLTRLGGGSVAAPADRRREPSLTFQEDPAEPGSGGYAGSGGCNRLIGTYRAANATMTLTSGGTMMACKDNAAAEAAFVAALKATRAYRIAGRTLDLMDAKGVSLARFEARPAAGITVR